MSPRDVLLWILRNPRRAWYALEDACFVHSLVDAGVYVEFRTEVPDRQKREEWN